MPGWLSDCFCRLATGGGYATRSLFTDDQVTYIHAQRPIILNGIDDFVKRGDLIDRSVFLNLAPIHPADRRTESELWSSFQFDYPRILGSLLDAVVLGMRILPSVELPEVSRMADFGYWGEAVGRGLGWPEHSFRSAYARNRRAATDSTIEDSAVADALFRSVPSSLKWSGSTSELHRQLTAERREDRRRSSRWPKHVARVLGRGSPPGSPASRARALDHVQPQPRPAADHAHVRQRLVVPAAASRSSPRREVMQLTPSTTSSAAECGGTEPAHPAIRDAMAHATA